MPLAIELAAARVKLLTPQQILDRLEHQLSLLTSGSRDLPERQQTLRGAIAWSYELLDDGLKRLLARLSVFSGGWDLAAAEAIAGSNGDDVLDGLSAVVDQSLARREEEQGSTRFEMLPTIRDFLREMLTEKDEMAAIADRHAAYYLALVEEAAPQLHGDRQREWMDRLEKEHDNLRAAIDWAAEKPDPETAARLGFAMWRFWQQRGYVTEARRRLEALEARHWDLSDELHARLLEAAGGVAYWQADHEAAVRWYADALAIWRRVGDRKEIANAIYNHSYGKLVPVIRGQRKMSTAELDDARKVCAEALVLFREAGDRVGEGNIAWALGSLHHFHGDYETSRKYFNDAIALFHETGQRTMEAWGRHMITLPLVRLGRLDEATASARGALSHFDEVGDLPGVAMVMRYLSGLAILAGDNRKAGLLYGAAEKLLVSTGAGLTAYLEDVFLERDPAEILSKPELDRLSKEGAAMPLAKVVAYAMESGDVADQPGD
jgi:tetratricopeptide (TPR) repeat protein